MISNQDQAVLFASNLIKVTQDEQLCFAKSSGSDERFVVLILLSIQNGVQGVYKVNRRT